MASVVIIRPAIEAAFCRAERVTLVGSRMPISINVADRAKRRRSPRSGRCREAAGGAGRRVVAEVARAFRHLVEDDAGLFAAVGDDLAQRGFHRAQGDGDGWCARRSSERRCHPTNASAAGA
jgi:hypothetical protein